MQTAVCFTFSACFGLLRFGGFALLSPALSTHFTMKYINMYMYVFPHPFYLALCNFLIRFSLSYFISAANRLPRLRFFVNAETQRRRDGTPTQRVCLRSAVRQPVGGFVATVAAPLSH